jgi:quinoprotein glucose dehydrogenase
MRFRNGQIHACPAPIGRISGSYILLVTAVLAFASDPPRAAEHDPPKPFEPKIAPASDEPRQAMAGIRIPAGLKIELFAAEPLLANPVAFCFDEKGRCYVAETFRIHHGVTDNRGHMDWLADDLASRTVADRIALYRKYLKEKFATYEIAHDRVRRLEDMDGDGVADRATVFADGFHSAADGIGSGVLARQGNVYYTCIPNLWLLRDTKGDGKADIRRTLSSGYGVHVSFYGHDLHGLRMGPDGRLYFSIGDRGLNVRTDDGRTLAYPDTGAVLRCEPDGSHLEVFATGLRNPQKLAFDEYGNLFTGDNNSDSGDKARLVYIVDGSDSGWRIGYQYGTSMGDRGPWNAEKLWHLPHPDQPAYIVPPIAHIADGPSGITYNPGAAALPERYDAHFFLCDFRGDPAKSGVRSFAVRPKGASFEMIDAHEFVWSVLATDCEFGPDGGFYVSDWVSGWEGTGKGRIYRVAEPARRKSAVVSEVRTLFAQGFAERPVDELLRLLEHQDMRVRQEAQFALAAKSNEEAKEAVRGLCRVAKESKHRLARIHSIWALGQVSRRRDLGSSPAGAARPKTRTESLPGGSAVRTEPARGPHSGTHNFAAGADLRSLLRDPDAEIRIQAVRTLGDSELGGLANAIPLLADAEPRVRLHAALSLGRRGRSLSDEDKRRALQAVCALLRENADGDAHLRHGSVMALACLGTVDWLTQNRDDSPAVRLGCLLALRRLHGATIRMFLSDPDPRLVVEAARAIHDVPIPEALPDLAHVLGGTRHLSDPTLYRALSAHFRLGKTDNAEAVAAFAARADVPVAHRVEAVKMLGAWAQPGRRDRITGETQDLGTRDGVMAANAMRHYLGGIFAGPDLLREEAARVAGRLALTEIGPTLFRLLADTHAAPSTRAQAIEALDALNDQRLSRATELALKDREPRVRNAGRRVLARRQPADAVAELRAALDRGELTEQQTALTLLGKLPGPDADTVLSGWLDRLLEGGVGGAIQLELQEAAGRRPSSEIQRKLTRWEASRRPNDPLAGYRETLLGGDASAGRDIFLNKTEVACLRCHKVQGQGGEVGPDLTGIGAKQTREYLLESIVDPSRQIAKGFDTVVLALQNGTFVSGVLKSETADEIRLITPEAQTLVVPKKEIEDRKTGKSAMPEDLIKHLTKSELRDLVEFLAGLK